MKTLRAIKIANLTILPIYMLLTSGQFASEMIFTWAISTNNVEMRENVIIYIIIINLTKLILTTVLSVTSLRFACQLGKIVAALNRQGGGIDYRNSRRL